MCHTSGVPPDLPTTSASRRAWRPPGQRWGVGARSVLPYLNHAVRSQVLAEVARDDAGPVRNPVFTGMDAAPSRAHAG